MGGIVFFFINKPRGASPGLCGMVCTNLYWYITNYVGG